MVLYIGCTNLTWAAASQHMQKSCAFSLRLRSTFPRRVPRSRHCLCSTFRKRARSAFAWLTSRVYAWVLILVGGLAAIALVSLHWSLRSVQPSSPLAVATRQLLICLLPPPPPRLLPQAFATTGTMQGAWYLTTGQILSLSEQQLVDCSWDYGNDGCGGGNMEPALAYVAKHGGAMSEEDYRYLGQNAFCG